MRYLDVCAGISASTVAWKPLGWQAAAYSEIEAAPRAILAHHYPETPLHGDFTTIRGDEYGPIDLLVGGTPCQSFSIAGLRGGLADDRGNLALEFLRLAGRARPRWIVWENVPGVFSALSHDAPDPCPPEIDLDASDGPRDGEEVVVEDEYDSDESHAFACFMAGLHELRYGAAYRVLDAQYAGVPQRRRRVFVVGYLGDWRPAAAVLFERHSLSGDSPPRRGSGSTIAGTLAAGAHAGGYNGQDAYNGQLIPFSIMPMNSGTDYVAREVDVAQPLMAGGPVSGNQGGDFIACRVSGNAGAWSTGDRTDALTSAHDGAAQHLIAFAQNQRNEIRMMDVAGALSADAGMKQTTYVRSGGVRKMMPREWERLQGFPDDYTLVPYRGRMMADAPRYKALGNSMAVPVMRWIGERIETVEAVLADRRRAA